MLERMTYLEEKDGVSICRCYGSGTYIDMPSFVHGKPVTALKDHCFAPEASIRIDRTKLKSVLRSEWQQEETGRTADATENITPSDIDHPMCALSLREIDLPQTLKRTEGYAFYGCRNLRRLRFPAAFETLGGGNFVDCNHLQYLEFAFEPAAAAGEDDRMNGMARILQTPDCMKDVVVDINYEIEARILEGDRILCQLLFPGYIEDSEENTPARIIAVKYEGMGYKYRQCFKDRKLDFDAYDALFYFTSVQELPPTILLCAMNRLRYPVMLSEKAEKAYLDYLKSCPETVFRKMIKDEDLDILQMLMDRSYFDRERMELCLQMASARGNGQIVSMLMEYRREHFAERKKRYSFVEEW